MTPEEIGAFGLRVYTYKMGEMVSVGIHLGDRLGLYRAMAGAGALTSAEVADRAGLDERFTREWLLGQAAADLVERDDDGRFTLTDAGALFLAGEPASEMFAAGSFHGGLEPERLDRVAESFRTGLGATYEDLGPGMATGMARSTAPSALHLLVQTVLPPLDGVVAKLESGAHVVDVGCGAGVALMTVAETYPASRCVGYDPSESAIALARERAAERGVENVSFVVGTSDDLDDEPIDLVFTFDCLHDMPRPDLAAAAIRRAIADDGTWLIKEIRSTGSFESDRRNPMLALMYGYSITSCLQSARSEPDGLGFGTLGLHPAAVEELVSPHGFEVAARHDHDGDAANLYYEVRVR